MNRLRWFFLVGLMALSGCAHQYTITLTNGTQLSAASKPKLEHGRYRYKDSRGRDLYIPEGRVREIAPASLANSDKSGFKPPTAAK